MEEKIEGLIEDSLKDTARLILGEARGKEDSRIIIPPRTGGTNAGEDRYSEQELKQIFISEVEKNSDFYYSVETPSKEKYRFMDKLPRVLFDGKKSTEKHESSQKVNETAGKQKKKSTEKYESSRIDVSVYDKQKKLVSHVEFKHGQCKEFDVKKDFLKLICESEKTTRNYFVHYFEKADKKTKEAIVGKYAKSLEYIKNYKDKNSKSPWTEKHPENIFVYVYFFGKLNKKYRFSFENAFKGNLEKDWESYEI